MAKPTKHLPPTPYEAEVMEAYNEAYEIVCNYKDMPTVLVEIIKNLIMKAKSKEQS